MRASLNFTAVALLDLDGFNWKEFVKYFIATELAGLMKIRHYQGKMEWLASKLSAKYLFLNRMYLDRIPSHSFHPGPLIRIDLARLNDFSPWMYRSVQILPRLEHPGSKILWQGKKAALMISVSHKEGMGTCILTHQDYIGIDLEVVKDRSLAFCRSSFTVNEMNWASQVREKLGMAKSWIFTLLWTIKESLIKSLGLKSFSILDFPQLEIRFISPVHEFLSIYNSKSFTNKFFNQRLEITLNHTKISAEVAVCGSKDLILTVLKNYKNEFKYGTY